MFALTRKGMFEQGCRSKSGYNYCIECIVK
jgi:hypothetical protein